MTRTNRVLNGHAKSGFHSGRLHAKNILAGRADVSLTTGSGTETITFAKPMKSADYGVILCSQETTSQDDLCLSVDSKSPQSFVINVTSSGHSSPIAVGFLVVDSPGAGLNHGGRFGFHSGYAHFRNLQWGKATITTDGSGDGTAKTIKLPKPMKHVPLIFASFDDSTTVTTGFLHLATGGSSTCSQFKLDVTGCSITNDTVDVTWVAYDPGFHASTTEKIAHTGSPTVEQNRQAKFGIHSGDFRAKNFIGAIMADDTDGNGDGTDSVTFGQMLRNPPICFVFIQSPVNDTTGVAYADSPSINSVTVGANNSATTSAALYYGLLVIDAEYLPTKEPESEQVSGA